MAVAHTHQLLASPRFRRVSWGFSSSHVLFACCDSFFYLLSFYFNIFASPLPTMSGHPLSSREKEYVLSCSELFEMEKRYRKRVIALTCVVTQRKPWVCLRKSSIRFAVSCRRAQQRKTRKERRPLDGRLSNSMTS